MTYRQGNSSCKDSYLLSQSRLNQQNNYDSTDEGCPVIEESGTVCGETNSLGIFQDFRQMYDDCLRKLEGTVDGNSTLKKMAPFKKFIDDLWEQNTMLVETVEELEQEATTRVTNLQDKLNKSCQKELHCLLKTKEREMESLLCKLSEKDELLKKYCAQIEDLKKDTRNKCKKYQEALRHLKAVQNDCGSFSENDPQKDCEEDIGELVTGILRNVEEQKKSIVYRLQNAECQIRALTAEKKNFLKEKNDISSQLQCLSTENERLVKEVTSQRKSNCEKEELLKTVDSLKSENKELLEKVSSLHENIKELNTNFKETRWALTSEVAEKHDQVQELKRCVAVLEEQLRQADMQTHFKDDIIKELRKELKTSRKLERPGLYDVVKELKERKRDNVQSKCSKQADMSKHQADVNSGFLATTSATDSSSRGDDKKSPKENEKLLSQIECLKKNLKAKAEELKCQEEFTRGLEEELAKTKVHLCVLEKYQNQEDQGKSDMSQPDLNRHHSTLLCMVNKTEDLLRDLCSKHNVEKEMEKIRCLKKELEKTKPKNESVKFSDKNMNKAKSSVCKATCQTSSEYQSSQCNLLHIEDGEKFKEKAITGAVALEQMKEQLDILENLIRNSNDEFSCENTKQMRKCDEKLEKLRSEFDEVTFQLCQILQKINSPSGVASSCTIAPDDLSRSSQTASGCTMELCRLQSQYQEIQNRVCEQQNEVEKLRNTSKQLEAEIEQKRCQLMEHTKELDSRACEIFRVRELIRKVCHRLKEAQTCPGRTMQDENAVQSPRSPTDNLCSLFFDLQELWCLLEKSVTTLFEGPRKLREDNEKLRENVGCLEKCVCNKEETVRHLQDTVKMRECQIEDLKSRMQLSECQSAKLAQDVEEKCRLIANLQEAVQKCKQLELNTELFETLRFEYCDLECKLEKYEKEILLRDQKLERLRNEITELTSKNFFLNEKLKILEPKLKVLYKTSHLFENSVCDLQQELNSKECEIETLYGRIKELESELDCQFKKCEERAAEDSKCIEQLSEVVRNYEDELSCAQEACRMSVMETENRLRKDLEMRECELNNTVRALKSELSALQDISGNTSSLNQTSAQNSCQNRIVELQKALECVSAEHEKEKKNILQKLYDEKKENVKNKSLITKLNENMKRKTQNETTLKDCIDRLTEEVGNFKEENHELKTEVEARKKVMCAMEKEGITNLTEMEELMSCLKIQKAELKARCASLKSEVEKEMKLRKLLEFRVDDLNLMLQNKMQKFNQMIENYKSTSSRLQQTYKTMNEIEESLICSQNSMAHELNSEENSEYNYLKLVDIKTAENAKLICQIQVLKVELESLQSEHVAEEANKDVLIFRLQSEVECLENSLQEFQVKFHRLNDENKKLVEEIEIWTDKGASMQNEFREKQKDLYTQLRAAICEKNELLSSMDELQKQLEMICLENANKEKLNRQLSEECTRLKINKDSDSCRSKSEKIICNLNKEMKNLQCELSEAKQNLDSLEKDYQALLDRYKCSEKKRCNLEKLYEEVNTENQNLLDAKVNYERELCELRTHNLLLKDKLAAVGESQKNWDDRKKLCDKIKELTSTIKTLENKVIPQFEEDIANKMCCIGNLQMELREANISNQKMRNEALKVVEHTRNYLSAQKFANETLKSRLDCSNKRGNMLGIENRELEDQLKAVTRMNEFLLRQLQCGKGNVSETEPRSFSPLPWGCSTVERDTSSSEYLAESGFQSMQPSPVIMDYDHESQYDSKRNFFPCNSLKKNKFGGSVEFPSCRNSHR